MNCVMQDLLFVVHLIQIKVFANTNIFPIALLKIWYLNRLSGEGSGIPFARDVIEILKRSLTFKNQRELSLQNEEASTHSSTQSFLSRRKFEASMKFQLVIVLCSFSYL